MGVRHVSPLVNVKTTDVNNPAVLYAVPDTRRVVIRKIMAYNKDSSANTLIILDGNGQVLPAIPVAATSQVRIGELELPAVEFYKSINAVLGASGTNGIDVVVEVEEEGS